MQLAEYCLAMRQVRGSQNLRGKERVMTISGGFGVYQREPYMRACSQFVDCQAGMFSLEDVYNTTTVAAMGLRTGYRPEVVVRTEVPYTFVQLARQRYLWERAILRNLVLNRNVMFSRSGWREETAWLWMNLVLLRPLRLILLPLALLINPQNLFWWGGLYVTVHVALLRFYSTASERKQIGWSIWAMPLVALVLELVAQGPAWCSEVWYHLRQRFSGRGPRANIGRMVER